MAEPKSRWVEAHGLRLHYLDWGGEGLPPMLLLHGLQDCAGLWRFFASGMRDRFRVMALDHRGHGESPHAGSYPLDDYVEETAAFMEALDLRDAVLIGHSAGGKNGWMCVAKHPGRVAKLVITDMDPDSQNPGSAAMFSRYKGESDEYADMDAVVERLRSRQPGSSEEVLRTTASALTKRLPGGGYTWKRDRGVVTKYERPDVWDSLPRVGVPTLIVRGAESTLLTRPVMERMQQAIPDCRFEEIPGGGHWAHLEDPERYLRIVSGFVS